jgi:hypothetical protein
MAATWSKLINLQVQENSPWFVCSKKIVVSKFWSINNSRYHILEQLNHYLCLVRTAPNISPKFHNQQRQVNAKSHTQNFNSR